MADYSKFKHSQIEEILNLYEIKDISSIYPQGHGISNSNYHIITIKHDYLLKISNDKSYEQLSEEIKILNYLNKLDFQYSVSPLKTKDNQYIFNYLDISGVLFPFIDAKVQDISKVSVSEIAKTLAKLHLLPINNELRKQNQIGEDFDSIKKFVNSSLCPKDFKDVFLEVFSNDKVSQINNCYDETIVHGDLYYDNCLFRNEELKVLIDFEQAGVGNSLLDIGISISGSCLRDNEIDQELVQVFLDSYQKIKKLTPTFLNSINSFIHLGLFSISLWRIHRFYLGSLNPEKKLSYQQLLTMSKNLEHRS